MIGDQLSRAGFTLTELMVVIMIIGILVAIGTPQYFKVTEKNKMTEAVNLFLAMKTAQDQYYAKNHAYCVAAVAGCAGFDLTMPVMSYFSGSGGANPFTTFAAGTGGTNPSWSASLTRTNGTSYYGNYTVVYDVENNTPPSFSCPGPCQTDLLPALN